MATSATVQPKLASGSAAVQRKAESDKPDITPISSGYLELQKVTGNIIQCKPSYLVNHNFMGISVEVNPIMARRLRDVESHLQSEYDALPATERATFRDLGDYAGLQTIRGWRSGSNTSKHASGSAVDVNYSNQPYIPTRSIVGGTTVYGGEEGEATTATRSLRQPAVEVYDRAVQFVSTNPYADHSADVSVRRPGESTTDVYRRFRRTSDALSTYLSLAIRAGLDPVRRVPITDVEGASEADLLSTIPTTERKDESNAVTDILAFMNNPDWQDTHGAVSSRYRRLSRYRLSLSVLNERALQRRLTHIERVLPILRTGSVEWSDWIARQQAVYERLEILQRGENVPFRGEAVHYYPLSAREQYIRILRDYEIVRKPMQRGNPTTTPRDTRNPARGFLHMPEHFVVAMTDQGHLRWGAADLPAGSAGDIHHFYLLHHPPGYPPDGTP